MKRMSGWTYLLLVVLVVSVLGCAARPRTAAMREEMAEFSAAEPQMEVVREAAVSADEGMQMPALAQVERKIIYTVSLDLIVKDTVVAFEEVERLTQEIGGFVSESNVWRDQEHQRASLTVRVPAEKLEDALAAYRALAVDVENQRLDSQDVTEEYVDLEARLTNEQRTEQELLELLETRSETGKTSDILEVHRELSRVRAQIEQIQGRMRYLENLSAMATIHINLTPDALLQPVVVAGWRPQGTARNAIRTLLRTLQFLADVAIVFVLLILPILLVIAIPITALFLGVRALGRRRKRRKSAQSE